jgi:hypothetical protein
MIPLVDKGPQTSVVAAVMFWLACGLAIVGGGGPLLVAAGATSRVGSVAIPFAVAAALMAILALFYPRGRAFSTWVYFAGGLAIAYGVLLALSVAVRLTVQSSCTFGSTCPAGVEPQLTGAESTGIGMAVTFGVLAMVAGFIGLVFVYRQASHARAAAQTRVWPDRPPEKPAPAESSAAETAKPETKVETEPPPA